MNIYEKIDEIKYYIDKMDKNTVTWIFCREDFDSTLAALIMFLLLKHLGFKVHIRYVKSLEDIDNSIAKRNVILINLGQLGGGEISICRINDYSSTYISYNVFKEYIKDEFYAIYPIIVSLLEFQDNKGELPEHCKELVEESNVKIEKDLRIIRCETFTLSDSLKLFFPPFLKGLSGNESGTKKFLKEIGLEDKRIMDLSNNEMNYLKQRLLDEYGEYSSIVGEVYYYKGKDLKIIAHNMFSIYKEDLNSFLKSFFHKYLDVRECFSYYTSLLYLCLNWVDKNINKMIRSEKFYYIYTMEKLNKDFIEMVLKILKRGKFIKDKKPLALFIRENNRIKIHMILTKRINKETVEKNFSDIIYDIDYNYPFLHIELRERVMLTFLQKMNAILNK